MGSKGHDLKVRISLIKFFTEINTIGWVVRWLSALPLPPFCSFLVQEYKIKAPFFFGA